MDVLVAITNKFRFRNLVLFTTLPALLVGALLWLTAGFLPSCSTIETLRLKAPDGAFDLVVFSRTCGPDTGPNTQAARSRRATASPKMRRALSPLAPMPIWCRAGTVLAILN